MKKLVLVLFFISPIVFSQQDSQDRIFFSQALAENLSDYNKKADRAYRFGDYEKGKELFREFTNTKLEGTYMDNVSFKNLKRKELRLYQFENPVFLITYASWCIPGKGEIPALNDLAEQYSGKIDFVVLFWDRREKARELAEQFGSHISLVYVDETENQGAYSVKLLKHSLGLPTCFLLSEEKEIMEIRRSVFPSLQTDSEQAYRQNFIALETAINKNLVKEIEGIYAENITLD